MPCVIFLTFFADLMRSEISFNVVILTSVPKIVYKITRCRKITDLKLMLLYLMLLRSKICWKFLFRVCFCYLKKMKIVEYSVKKEIFFFNRRSTKEKKRSEIGNKLSKEEETAELINYLNVFVYLFNLRYIIVC